MSDRNIKHPENVRPGKIRKQKKKKRRPRSFIGIFFEVLLGFVKIFSAVLCICIVAGLLAGFILWNRYAPAVADAENKAQAAVAAVDKGTFVPTQDTVFYASDGSVLCRYAGGTYTPEDYDYFSPNLIKVYVGTEDSNFWTHKGYDPEAILRAGAAYIKNHGKITQGGSTITQQLVKNCLLSPEQTFERKITEVFAASYLEKKYTKKEIMAYYLNTNFYGNGLYGAEAASQYYFGHGADKMTLEEAAVLAGISNAPTKYNPKTHPDACTEKRDSVLHAVYYNGLIDRDTYISAVRHAVTFVYAEPAAKYGRNRYDAPEVTYAFDSAVRLLMEKEGFAFRYTYSDSAAQKAYAEKYSAAYRAASEEIKTGGWQIKTSLDPSVQKMLQKTVTEHAEKFDSTHRKTADGKGVQASACVTDNKTGFVKAVVGSADGKGEYNRAYQAYRQPGSSIKPVIVYTPAFSEGLAWPSLVINDRKIEGKYSPKNSSGRYYGNITVRNALKESVNTVAYRIFTLTGPDKALPLLASMRFRGLSWQDNGNPAMALGGFTAGTNVTEMAQAYSAIADGGVWSEKTCIVSMENADGVQWSADSDAETVQAYTPQGAFMAVDCMKGVVKSGTGTAARLSGDIPQAGKTGTANGSTDTWFCGFTKSWTVTVWMGYDTPVEMKGEYGGGAPAEIWKDTVQNMYGDSKKDSDWEAPDGVAEGYVGSGGKQTDRRTGTKDWFLTEK